MARVWETLQVSLLLLTLLAVFFGKAVFLGRKLLPVDIIYTDPIFLGHAPVGFTTPHNALLYDQAYQFYPWRVYISQVLRQGFLPFWNPYIYCGTPFMAEDQPAVFYPLNILSYVMSPPDAALFTAIARLLIAGLATYWLVRNIGGGRFGALISAVTFAFSGFMVVWLGHPHTNVAAWLPALFLTLEWLYQKASARHVAFVALVMGTQLTGGHAETALYTLSAGGVYYLFRLVTAWRSARSLRSAGIRLLSFGAAVVLGFSLAAIHLLPFWGWIRQSAVFNIRVGADRLVSWRPGLKYQLAGILLALLPNAFNNPTWPGEYRSFLPIWNFAEQTLYVGIVSLSLAVYVAVRRRRDNRVWFLAALGVAALGAALSLPPFDLLNHVPLFSIAKPGRLRLIYTFCVSLLAGLGADDLVTRHRQDDALRAVIALSAGFVTVMVSALLVLPRLLASLADSAAAAVRQWLSHMLSWAFSLSNGQMYWPAVIAVAGTLIWGLYRYRILNRKTVQSMVLTLVVVDLFAFGINYHTTLRPEFIFPETPTLQLLKDDQDIFRIAGTDVHLMPNTCMTYGLHDVRGLEFPNHRYRELMQAIGGQDWLGYGILFSDRLQTKFLGLLNVKYVLTSSLLDSESLQDLRLVDMDKDVKIYQNLSCLPRAFVVYRVQVAQDSQDVMRILLDSEFDLSSQIVLEKPPPFGFAEGVVEGDAGLPQLEGGSAQQDASVQATVEITRYEPNYVKILTSTLANGFLFLSDSYYPGWKAYVDGVETEIYQADYAFRAVCLTAGQHTIEFTYEPELFRPASVTSLLALLGVIVLLMSRGSQKEGNSVTSFLKGGDVDGQ